MKMLLIKQATNDKAWYKEYIGQTVDYAPIFDDDYQFGAREPEGFLNFVRKEDAVIVEVDQK